MEGRRQSLNMCSMFRTSFEMHQRYHGYPKKQPFDSMTRFTKKHYRYTSVKINTSQISIDIMRLVLVEYDLEF